MVRKGSEDWDKLVLRLFRIHRNMAPGGHSISVLRAMKKIKDKSSVANGKMVACLLGCRECLGKTVSARDP